MLSAVGESAQAALQATTIGPSPQVVVAAKVDSQAVEKKADLVGGGGQGRDTVTISPEARQLTSVALNSAEGSQESSSEKSKEESDGKR